MLSLPRRFSSRFSSSWIAPYGASKYFFSNVACVSGAAKFENWSYKDPCLEMPTTPLPSVKFSLAPRTEVTTAPDIEIVGVFEDDTAAGGDEVLELAIKSFVQSKPPITENGNAATFEAGEMTPVVSTPHDNNSNPFLRKTVAYSLGSAEKIEPGKAEANISKTLRKLGASVSNVCGEVGAGSVEVRLPASVVGQLSSDAVSTFVEVNALLKDVVLVNFNDISE